MILFYDTETTGKIKNFSKPVDGSSNFPNIVQLAWQLYDMDGNLIVSCSNLIKPNGWKIEAEAEAIHGKSLEMCEADGIPIKSAIGAFIRMHRSIKLAVAHNHNFDSKIVRAELYRLGGQSYRFKDVDYFCTMHATTSVCKIKKTGKAANYGGYKWPKLEELHQYLFDRPIEDAHDALGDVRATAACFFELLNRGLIDPFSKK